MERRFVRDPVLREEYQEFIDTYEKLGYTQRVPVTELNNPQAWYLPHHALLKISAGKRKLRVVFDAFRSSGQHPGLNSFLLPGPPLQNDLALVLTDWRRH